MEECDLSLGYYRGPCERVLAGLDHPAFEGALLEMWIDGSAKILELVTERTRDRPELADANYRARHGGRKLLFVHRDSGSVQLPLEGDNLSELRRLADETWMVAFELTVRRDGRIIAWAPDVGDNEIWVDRDLPAEAVEHFKRALGDGLSPVEDEA